MQRDGNTDRGRCVPCRTEKDCKQDGQVIKDSFLCVNYGCVGQCFYY